MSKQNDIQCPDCGVLISFKNVIAFEPEEMTLEAIAYFITCKKCDCTFVTPLRYSTKATKEQEEVVKDMLDGFLSSRGKKK